MSDSRDIVLLLISVIWYTAHACSSSPYINLQSGTSLCFESHSEDCGNLISSGLATRVEVTSCFGRRRTLCTAALTPTNLVLGNQSRAEKA